MTEKKPFAFVLMPFDASFDDIYKLGIQAAAKDNNVVAERVDEQRFTETILNRIYRQIESADFIIADMTGRNPNVYYEVGYAHAKDKLCTLLTSNADDIPFDLRHHRHLVYGDSIQFLKDQLDHEFKWAKDEIRRIKTIPLNIELSDTSGFLVKDEYQADAEVTLTFDIRNRTEKRSPEIEAIYFYTSESWKFQQDGTECPSTKSETDGYPERRHFIKSQLSRLSHGAWTQIKITGRKHVWNKWDGTDLKSEYNFKGRTMIEIVTSQETFSQEINIDVTATDIPF